LQLLHRPTALESEVISSGTAPEPGKDQLQLFVSGESATAQGDVYYRTSHSPIDITGGIWNVKLGELGTPGKDIDHLFTLILVRANPICSTQSQQIRE
jgi:hypothetical protein